MYQAQIIKSILQASESSAIDALEIIAGREGFVFKSDDYLSLYESIIKYFDSFDKIPSPKYLIEHFVSAKSELVDVVEELMKDKAIEPTEDLTALVSTQIHLNVKKHAVEVSKTFGSKIKTGGVDTLQEDLSYIVEDLVNLEGALDLKEHKRGLLAVNPNDIKTVSPVEKYKKKYRKRQAAESYYIGKFGIDKIDNTLNGVNRSDNITVLGFTNQGKSPLLRQFGYNWLCQGLNVVFLTFEMGYDQIEDAFYTLHAANYKKFGFKAPRITSNKLKTTTLDKKEEAFLFDTVIPDFTSSAEMGSLYIIQPESDEYSLNDLFADVRKIHKTIMPVDVLILDYATLMIPSKKIPSPDRDQINRMLRRLRMFSLTFDRGRQLTILNAAQSNRGGYEAMLKHPNHLYDLSALSDYNALERDSTIIISVAQTPEDAAANQVRIQNLKSRETAKFLPFLATFDGETGTYHNQVSSIDDDDAIDIIDQIEV